MEEIKLKDSLRAIALGQPKALKHCPPLASGRGSSPGYQANHAIGSDTNCMWICPVVWGGLIWTWG